MREVPVHRGVERLGRDMTLKLTIGLPGSGKSTYAREQAEADPNVRVSERDIVRLQLTGSRRDHSQETRVTAVQRLQVGDWLAAGYVVIVSDTNLRWKYRKRWVKLAESLNVPVEFVHIDTPIEVCIARDAQRPDPVGEEVIRKMEESRT